MSTTPDRPDHEHTCRDCGDGIVCFIPTDDCDDIPNGGQCDECYDVERGFRTGPVGLGYRKVSA